MPVFCKKDGLYGVQIITGPRLAVLWLGLLDEQIEDFDVVVLTTGARYRDPRPEVVRARVREGTEEANRVYGTAFHPWHARYAVMDFNNKCIMLRQAAHAIVQRLAEHGDAGYEGLS